jgi:glycosyltransferase involved in cell wall biosynthesis
MALKILVVGTIASVHTGRFVSSLQHLGYDVRVFNHSPDYVEDEHLRKTELYVQFPRPSLNANTIVRWPTSIEARLRLELWKLKRRLGGASETQFAALYRDGEMRGACAIATIVETWRPSLVISLKMQNDGYMTAQARAIMGTSFPPWLHFNWGTDIAHFGLDPAEGPLHLPRIKAVLALCDFHIADCDRDVRLATEFGLRGESLGSCLATGGFDAEQLRTIRAAAGPRTHVLVKARHWPPVGVAQTVMTALDTIDDFGPLRFRFIMATPDMEEQVRARAAQGAPFEIGPRLAYQDLLAEFARARFTISATTIDGTPLFLAETMALGSVPLHSDLDSVREWVTDGENGLLFPPHDAKTLAGQIRRAMTDDAFIERASALNLDVASQRMDRTRIGLHLRDLIENRILATGDLRESRRKRVLA